MTCSFCRAEGEYEVNHGIGCALCSPEDTTYEHYVSVWFVSQYAHIPVKKLIMPSSYSERETILPRLLLADERDRVERNALRRVHGLELALYHVSRPSTSKGRAARKLNQHLIDVNYRHLIWGDVLLLAMSVETGEEVPVPGELRWQQWLHPAEPVVRGDEDSDDDEDDAEVDILELDELEELAY